MAPPRNGHAPPGARRPFSNPHARTLAYVLISHEAKRLSAYHSAAPTSAPREPCSRPRGSSSMPSACMRSPSRDGGLGLRALHLERNAWGTMRAWVLARRVSGLGGVLGYGSAGVESGAGMGRSGDAAACKLQRQACAVPTKVSLWFSERRASAPPIRRGRRRCCAARAAPFARHACDHVFSTSPSGMWGTARRAHAREGAQARVRRVFRPRGLGTQPPARAACRVPVSLHGTHHVPTAVVHLTAAVGSGGEGCKGRAGSAAKVLRRTTTTFVCFWGARD